MFVGEGEESYRSTEFKNITAHRFIRVGMWKGAVDGHDRSKTVSTEDPLHSQDTEETDGPIKLMYRNTS